MAWDKLKILLDDLLTLNDDNLARRVLETNDVQNCLEELYTIITGGVN